MYKLHNTFARQYDSTYKSNESHGYNQRIIIPCGSTDDEPNEHQDISADDKPAATK